MLVLLRLAVVLLLCVPASNTRPALLEDAGLVLAIPRVQTLEVARLEVHAAGAFELCEGKVLVAERQVGDAVGDACDGGHGRGGRVGERLARTVRARDETELELVLAGVGVLGWQVLLLCSGEDRAEVERPLGRVPNVLGALEGKRELVGGDDGAEEVLVC